VIDIQEELGYEGDFIFDRAIGCTITWKTDQDLTKEIEIKKQRNKHTNKTRLVRKVRIPFDSGLEPLYWILIRIRPQARTVPSFFNFFTPPVPPTEEQMQTGELDEEELEELDAKLEMDYQIGEDFKEKVRITFLSSSLSCKLMVPLHRSFLALSIISLGRR